MMDKNYKLTLVNKMQNTSDVYSFVFKPDTLIKWKAGQFMYFTLLHENPDSRGVKRYFTISSAPFEKNIMITTKFVKEGGSSFKKALLNLPIGSTIEASSPKGSLIIEGRKKSAYTMIAGGIGITPFRSIILDLYYKKKLENIILLYANSNEEIVFKDEFDRISAKNDSFKVYYIISPQRIDSSKIIDSVTDFSKYIYMIAGPIGMVKTIEDILVGLGVEGNSIKKDFFPGY